MPKVASRTSSLLFFAGFILLPAVQAAPAAAQSFVPPQMRSEAMALMTACRADYDRLCGGVQPGGGRILACLQQQAANLSAPCAQVMPRAQMLLNGAAAAGVLPK